MSDLDKIVPNFAEGHIKIYQDESRSGINMNSLYNLEGIGTHLEQENHVYIDQILSLNKQTFRNTMEFIIIEFKMLN